MFLHVGGDVSISTGELIAIIDAASGRRTAAGRAFLDAAKDRGHIKDVSGGTIHAYVITDHAVYASPISPITLKKRADAVTSAERAVP